MFGTQRDRSETLAGAAQVVPQAAETVALRENPEEVTSSASDPGRATSGEFATNVMRTGTLVLEASDGTARDRDMSLQREDPGNPEWTSELRAELLDPESWGKILEIYAQSMHLAVALLDADGGLVGRCHNPQPIWSLARLVRPIWPGVCPFCLESDTRCCAASDALRTRSVTLVHDPSCFAHVAVSLTLGDRHVGTLLAGQVLDRYPEPLLLQRVARDFGLSPQQLWDLARQQCPISRANLMVYGELLAALGQTFLRDRYGVILERGWSETARYLALTVASSDDAIISKNLNGFVTSWNTAAERLFGYSAADIVGQSVLNLIPPELVEEEVAILARVRQGERIHSYETTRVGSEGRRIAISLTISPVLNPGGRVIGISSFCRDISERKTLETAFRDSERTQRQAVEAGEVGLWSYDIFSRNLYGTSRCKAIFGLSEEAPVPSYRECLRMIHRDDAKRVEHGFQSSFRKRTVLDMEFRVVDQGGVVRWAQVKGCSSRDPDGKVTKIQGTLIDFTRRKETEEVLRRTNEQLREFAYAAAHDLQEPLRNISLSIQLALAKEEEFDCEGEALLRDAARKAQQMTEMLKDLLGYSRILHNSDGQWPVTDCNEALASALQNLSFELSEASAQVTHDQLPTIKMERAHLLRIFQNLIGNALKYRSLDAPRIHIGAALHQSTYQFYVRDNGIGIESQFHERVFGLFKRLHKKEVSGTGIGLAVCKSIVEHYGGKIWIESDGKKGATFFFTAPAAEKIHPEIL